MLEPEMKRVAAFVDGQNLFKTCEYAFGYNYPNYDVRALSELIASKTCAQYVIESVNFYTGVHSQTHNPFWRAFWEAKAAQMGHHGVKPHLHTVRLCVLGNGAISREQSKLLVTPGAFIRYGIRP